MRVLIYTAEHRSAIDAFDISYLLTERPSYEYAILAVRNPPVQLSVINKLKRKLVALRDGPNHWLHDLERLDRLIRSAMPSITNEPPIQLVDRVNDEESVRFAMEFAPDIIVQAGAGILRPAFFNTAKIATINIHHGIAPEVRGMRSTFWCMYFGLTQLIGATCHRIDETLDTGEVIHQERYDYQPGDTYVRIQEALCRIGAKLLVKSMDDLQYAPLSPPIRSEVDSYYFSELDPANYTALTRNRFLPLGEPHSLSTKRKVKLQMAHSDGNTERSSR